MMGEMGTQIILILNICVMLLTVAVIVILFIRESMHNSKQGLINLAKEWAIMQRSDILIIMDERYRVVHASDSAKRIFPELVRPQSIKAPDSIIMLLGSKNEVVDLVGYSFICTSTPIQTGTGQNGYAIFLSEVTEQERLKKELEKAREETREAVEAKKRFMSSVTHEIRTPVNMAMDMSEMLQSADLSESKREEVLENMRTSNDTLLTMIRDMSDLSDLEDDKLEVQPEEYDPRELVHSIENTAKVRIGGKAVDWITNVDESLPAVLYGDAIRIRQVLVSMVNNAVKFTHRGSITFEMHALYVSLDTIRIRFVIKDTGLGFKEKDIDKLFTPFHTTGGSGKESTGLELSVAKKLVELMGGKMSVESEYGRGTAISFELDQKILDADLNMEYDSSLAEMPYEENYAEASNSPTTSLSEQDSTDDIIAIQMPVHPTSAPEGVTTPQYMESLPGIDRWAGIEGCGSEEMFTEMMGDYHDLIPEKAERVRTLLAAGDIKNYTIEVHALKSTSRMIGLLELGEEFYALEQYGNANDVVSVESKTPDVLAKYERYTKILEPFGHVENLDGEQIPKNVLLSCLRSIHDGMDSFDLDKADQAIREMDRYSIPEKYRSQMGELRNMVTDVAMEDVLDLTQRLIAMIEADAN